MVAGTVLLAFHVWSRPKVLADRTIPAQTHSAAQKRSFRAVLQLACMTLAFTFPLLSFRALCNTVLLGKSKAILIIAAKAHASAAQSPARLERFICCKDSQLDNFGDFSGLLGFCLSLPQRLFPPGDYQVNLIAE